MKRTLLIAMLMAAPMPALAHKVIAAVFPSGDMIEGEIGFSNGDMATVQLVEVTAPDGSPLGTAVTDDEGFFTFVPTKVVEHRFRADLGAGHVASASMSAAEVAHLLGATPPADAPTQPSADDTVLTSDLHEAIATIVRDEIRPLRREIAATREHQNLQSILGGIGYIIGLFGVGFYFAARRKLKS